MPWRISRPWSITITSSAISAISDRRWLDTSTALPRPANHCRNSRSHRMPCGSRPFAGSSRISTCGSPSSAPANPRRCRMPSEYPPALRSAASVRSTAPTPRRRSRRTTPEAAASTRRWFRPVRSGWKLWTSSTAPTAVAGRSMLAYGRPRTVAEPAVGRTRPSTIRIVVLLPAPFGPRKPVTRPGRTSKLRSSTAVHPPEAFRQAPGGDRRRSDRPGGARRRRACRGVHRRGPPFGILPVENHARERSSCRRRPLVPFRCPPRG